MFRGSKGDFLKNDEMKNSKYRMVKGKKKLLEFSDELIEMLEQRMNDPKARYISAEESIRIIKEKYDIKEN
jgi:hypothetical protein